MCGTQGCRQTPFTSSSYAHHESFADISPKFVDSTLLSVQAQVHDAFAGFVLYCYLLRCS